LQESEVTVVVAKLGETGCSWFQELLSDGLGAKARDAHRARVFAESARTDVLEAVRKRARHAEHSLQY